MMEAMVQARQQLRRMMPQQRDAFRYARSQEHPGLLMDPRLGKNLPTIRRVLLYIPLDPELGLRVLVVAPSSVLHTWRRELELEGELDVAILLGTREQRLELLAKGHRWYLLNHAGWRSVPEIADQDFVNWDVVILDESIVIKNPKAKVTDFYLKNFRDCPHRWILTGLPNPESDLELWCQLAFLDGAAFGHRSYWGFRTECFEQTFQYSGWTPIPGTPSLIRRTLGRRAFVLRRQDAGMDNERVYQRREITPLDEWQEQYDKIEKEFAYEVNGNEESTVFSIVQYMWLRQMCGGFLDEELIWDGKYTELVTLLKGEFSQQPVVVWFAFNQELHQASERLAAVRPKIKHAWVTGEVTDIDERDKRMERFRSGKVPVLLLQEALAPYGLDFSISDTAIYFSTHPSFNMRRQSEERIMHPKKKTPLLYLDFVVPNSVDEDLQSALEKKKRNSSLTLARALVYSMQERRKRDVHKR